MERDCGNGKKDSGLPTRGGMGVEQQVPLRTGRVGWPMERDAPPIPSLVPSFVPCSDSALQPLNI